MDALRVAVGSEGTVSSARPRKTVRCDSCAGEGAFGNGRRCEVCGGAGKRDLHAFEIRVEGSDAPADVIDRWQKALEVRNASGSYEALERALAGIRVHVNKPERFVLLTVNATQALRLLDEVFLPPAGRVFDELGIWEQRLVGLAIEYIELRMPDPIRVPADVRLNARELVEHRKRVKGRSVSNGAVRVRDEEIRRLVRRDVPVQRVAFDFGLSVSQVNRIVAGDEAA